MYLKLKRRTKLNFKERFELSYCKQYYRISKNNNEDVILEGKFYYYNSSHERSSCLKENTKIQLENLIKKYDFESFTNNVEGEYCGVWINKKDNSLRLFNDKLKQRQLYYFSNKHFFIVSDDCKRIIDRIGQLECEVNSLISSILLYVPGGHTLFKNIFRLKYNEFIEFKNGQASIRKYMDRDILIKNYSNEDLLRYEKILLNSVFTRASDSLNLVFSSGGWDSTMLLAILRKNLRKDKVKGITMRIIFPDGRCFNEFEIFKSKKICKSLDIDIDIIDVDYRKNELYDKYNEVATELFLKNLFYLWPTKWAKATSDIKDRYGREVVIFNGEGSDSLHNYGFAQYISLSHENNYFREYADKMKNYLFGPTFFKKIKDNAFMDDAIYQIFLFFNRNKDFIKVCELPYRRKIFYYIFSFVYSDVRLPFRKIATEGYIKESAFKNFEKWLEEHYFKVVGENINENNFYYYLSYLYLLFHLQSPQISIFRQGLDNVRFPFIDKNLFKFLYKMPQSFGRGLEFNHIKFPLKELTKELLTEKQIGIITKGAHSYLSEIEKMNINDEYLLKGADYRFMKDNIKPEKAFRFFKDSVFYKEKIYNLIKQYKSSRKCNLSDTQARILMLCTLFSIN